LIGPHENESGVNVKLEAKNNEAMQESGRSLTVYDIIELVEKD